jgi:hypothetical protein
MKTVLESDVFTYEFDGTFCSPSYYAYTWKGARRVVYCDAYDRISGNIFGKDTKLCTVIHELAHAVFHADDVEIMLWNWPVLVLRMLLEMLQTTATSWRP